LDWRQLATSKKITAFSGGHAAANGAGEPPGGEVGLMRETNPKRDSRFRLATVCALALLAVGLLGVAGAQAGLLADSAGSPRSIWTILAEALPTVVRDKPADKRTAYTWSASRVGSTLKLRGLVPSEEDRRTVLGMAKAHFADLAIEDRLKIANGGPPKEQWLGAVSFGLKQLSHLKQGSARLLNAGLKVEGEARSGDDYAEVKKALSGPMPTGLTVLNENVRPPIVDPFAFVASLNAEALTLSGNVPSEDVRKLVKESARRLFERPTLDDRLQLASGAPKAWDEAVEVGLQALSRLETGKIALSGLALSIEGEARDKGTAVALSYQLRRDLPALFSSTESIRWKEAEVTRDVGEAIIPRIKETVHTSGGLATGTLPAEQ
jgi:hypothetical protein